MDKRYEVVHGDDYDKLGARQKGCIDSLEDHGLWKTGYCSWQWSTPSETKKIMDSLVKRGLVRKTKETWRIDGLQTIYRIHAP